MKPHEPLWTLDDLCARVALALAVDYAGQASGRVRDVPDRRTIRYYTTLGLLDRPAQMRGRTALYGRRHLLQLAAIKRLQTRGLPLAEIQQRLVGLSGRALEELARLPADLEPGEQAREQEEAGPQTAERRGGAFWTTTPAPVVGPGVRVPLAPGVTLELQAARELDEFDRAALAAAAAPLVKLLQTRRMVPWDKNDSSPQGDSLC